MMRIESNKVYKVERMEFNGNDTDFGNLPGSDVRKILKGYKYDDRYDLWFSKGGNVGYSVKEV